MVYKLIKSNLFLIETNLKKQGILPLTFVNPADYDKITENALISTSGLTKLMPVSSLNLIVLSQGKEITIPVTHTMSQDQIEWFKAGSALNLIAKSFQQ